MAALEAYMKTHPSKEEDKEALRKRAKELSASIGSGQVSPSTSARDSLVLRLTYSLYCVLYETFPLS